MSTKVKPDFQAGYHVFAEIDHAGDRVEVHFRYNPDLVKAIKEIPGARYVNPQNGGPKWTIPLALDIARKLREQMGDRLVLGQAYKVWGREAVKRDQNLKTLAGVDSLEPEELKIHQKLPEFTEWLRPYQRADIKFLAETSALNLNEQRLGKTPEIFGAIFEADLEHGPHLVCAPKSALDTVWRFEIERWTEKLEKPHEVITYHGELSHAARKAAIEEFWACIDDDWPVWFVCTYDAVRRGMEPNVEKWATFTIDEFHRSGLTNAGGTKTSGSQFSNAVKEIEADRRYALSGTPMGGKVIKLWGGLHFLYRKQFTSKWNWAKLWLNIDQDYGHKTIGGIKEGQEDAFYESLAPFVVRRLRSEVLPQLPPAQWIDVWYEMTPKQAKQYSAMADDAETLIEDEALGALGVLAQYTRLKIFADAYCDTREDRIVTCSRCKGEKTEPRPTQKDIDEYVGDISNMPCKKCQGEGKVLVSKAIPSYDSGLLPALMDKLAEQGIDPKDPEGDSLAIISSQFSEVAEMVHRYLNEKGIKAELITGDVSQTERNRIQMLFRDDGKRKAYDARVVVMTTTAGGVAITLDKVENVHILDETWVPDDQEQLADRAVNTSRLHQVGVYVYRARGTIEEDIQETNIDKRNINREILDLRRQGFRATVKKSG
jgi:SNF2 family DNA or RNA helicase